MEVNYEAVASPVFKAMQESPTCGSKVEIVDPKTITLTWDVKEAKEAKAAKQEEEDRERLVDVVHLVERGACEREL